MNIKPNTLKWAAIIALTTLGLTTTYIFKQPDNPAEQAAESLIDDTLGLPRGTIDLSPGSK